METHTSLSNKQIQQQYQCTFQTFWYSFNIPTILNRCRIRKVKGYAAKDIFYTLFTLPFLGMNFYNGIINNKDVPYGKDAVYEFLKCPTFNWRKFLLVLAVQIVAFLASLTSNKREKVLIIDDSTLGRPRSKKVELLAKVFDHCENKYLKGYRLLSVCWSDGASFLPLDYALLSSANQKNRIQGITKDLDKRCCGYKRRIEAMTKSTDLLEPMVSRILNMGVKAKYVLMDSWFAMPKTIAGLRKHINVICMIKKTPKIFYDYKGKQCTVEGIYRLLRKRPGRAKILASAVVGMKYGGQAKIVFVRDKRKKDWLALLTTDVKLPNEEVFFKMSKQHLGLEKNIQTRDFDSQIAYTSIVMARYMFLAVEQRRREDPRTFGLLFQACCKEMKDLSFLEALKRILELVVDKLRKAGEYTEQIYKDLISTIFGTAIDFFQLNKQLYQRT